jgi:endonuclease-3
VTATAPAWRPPSRERVARLRRRLLEVYGRPCAPPHGDPLAELVLTVLSQSTNDRNRDVAFLRLRERFSGWDAVRAADVAEIEEAIRPGGISKVKSARIKAILEGLVERTGSLDLAWMRDTPVAESRDLLCALPGVGRKTAACVLLFSYGLRDVPVDTHVSRWGRVWRCSRPGRRCIACTTRCSRSLRPAPSSSSTSTSCAMAGGPVTRSVRRAPPAACGVPARAGRYDLRRAPAAGFRLRAIASLA